MNPNSPSGNLHISLFQDIMPVLYLVPRNKEWPFRMTKWF